MSNFISFPLFFLLTHNKLKFRQPRQPYHLFGPAPEVLGLLPSSLPHCFITKKAQNQEKRAFYQFSANFFSLRSVNSNSGSHVNCTSHVDSNMRFWDKKNKIYQNLQSYKFHNMRIGNHTNRHNIGFAWLPILRYVDIFHTRHCTTVITPKTLFSLFSYKLNFFQVLYEI